MERTAAIEERCFEGWRHIPGLGRSRLAEGSDAQNSDEEDSGQHEPQKTPTGGRAWGLIVHPSIFACGQP
jgi:hypothetical protein